jgi:hypothetical protein
MESRNNSSRGIQFERDIDYKKKKKTSNNVSAIFQIFNHPTFRSFTKLTCFDKRFENIVYVVCLNIIFIY